MADKMNPPGSCDLPGEPDQASAPKTRQDNRNFSGVYISGAYSPNPLLFLSLF